MVGWALRGSPWWGRRGYQFNRDENLAPACSGRLSGGGLNQGTMVPAVSCVGDNATKGPWHLPALFSWPELSHQPREGRLLCFSAYVPRALFKLLPRAGGQLQRVCLYVHTRSVECLGLQQPSVSLLISTARCCGNASLRHWWPELGAQCGAGTPCFSCGPSAAEYPLTIMWVCD